MVLKTRKKIRKLLIVTGIIGLVIVLFSFWFRFATSIPIPDIDTSLFSKNKVVRSDSFYSCGSGWLQKNRYGLWEMYIEGKPYERGIITGKLSSELIEKQEEAFIAQLRELVPSKLYINFLNQMVKWFNRNIYKLIPQEYLEEIYGVSQSASDKFSFIGSNYCRILNYHAAHDIGHAMQQYHFTACTSFSVWGNKSTDSSLIIGRNFDFYAGDDFCKDKIVCFIKPEHGIPFAMITWGGMTGVTSGMNLKGLTVTINAGKSKIPFSAKTPVTIVAREILQYASNIKEAFNIAKKSQLFISESFMIGSAEDGETAIIEKSPLKTALRTTDGNFIISTNHFLDTVFDDDKMNKENILKSASFPRYQRTLELINGHNKHDINTVSSILRNRFSIKDKAVGQGNEIAINQLIAHHSVIFSPQRRIIWVSTSPWQLGEYIAYDLNKIFHDYSTINKKSIVYEAKLTIPKDSFLSSVGFSNFLKYKELKKKINLAIHNKEEVTDKTLNTFISLNPEYYEAYIIVNSYYQSRKNFSRAMSYCRLSLAKEVPSLEEKERIEKELLKCKSNL